jgi:hypothetical protein
VSAPQLEEDPASAPVPAYRTPGVAIYGTLVGGIASGGAADTFDRIGRSPR